jgi:hypothetical protein
MNEATLGGINTASGQTAACREGSQTIIERRQRENVGRAEMYEWLSESMKARPMTKLAEEQLWSLLLRERPY